MTAFREDPHSSSDCSLKAMAFATEFHTIFLLLESLTFRFCSKIFGLLHRSIFGMQIIYRPNGVTMKQFSTFLLLQYF